MSPTLMSLHFTLTYRSASLEINYIQNITLLAFIHLSLACTLQFANLQFIKVFKEIFVALMFLRAFNFCQKANLF